MISLGVGDEVSRDCNSQENEDETGCPPRESSPRLLPQPDQTPEPTQPSEEALSEVPGSSSSPFPSTSSHPPVTKAQTISTSTSSPAICNMEADPSSAWTARGGVGADSGMAASSSHGTRASELNVGPALGKSISISVCSNV